MTRMYNDALAFGFEFHGARVHVWLSAFSILESPLRSITHTKNNVESESFTDKFWIIYIFPTLLAFLLDTNTAGRTWAHKRC